MSGNSKNFSLILKWATWNKKKFLFASLKWLSAFPATTSVSSSPDVGMIALLMGTDNLEKKLQLSHFTVKPLLTLAKESDWHWLLIK